MITSAPSPSISLQPLDTVGPTVAVHDMDESIEALNMFDPETVMVLLA